MTVIVVISATDCLVVGSIYNYLLLLHILYPLCLQLAPQLVISL